MKYITLAIIVLSLLNVAAAPAQTQTCAVQHKVALGDTLFKLGQRYNVDWREILRANNVRDVMNLQVGSTLCIPKTTAATPAPKPPTTTTPPTTVTATPLPSLRIPLITIVSVIPKQSVTITGAQFLPNDVLNVTMGAMGTRGVGGVSVGQFNAGTGSFTTTFKIPAQFANTFQIAIRMQSPSTGFYSFNWFYNN